jgi:lysophospholipase L1-like esterase
VTVGRALRLVYFNLSLFCFLVVGLEVTGQVVYFAWKGYPLAERSRHLLSKSEENPFEVHPFLAGRLKNNLRLKEDGKSITTIEDHTRWTGASTKNTDSIKIALLGGSTTFGSGVTDVETWPARLQAILGSDYQVANYGVPGYSSAEAIIQLALVVPENRPDIVVLYQGWNDIHNYHDTHLGVDYYAHGLRQYSNLAIQRPSPEGLFPRLAELSTICRMANVLSRKLFERNSEPARAENPAYPPPDPTGNPSPDPFVDRLYVRNLGTLKALAHHHGAFVLFVPQVMDYSRFSGTSGNWWTPHVQNAAMPRLFARFNLFMNQVCRPHEMGCAVLSDVTERMWRPDDFIDEGHFSEKGNLAFAQFIASYIKEIGERIPRSPSEEDSFTTSE